MACLERFGVSMEKELLDRFDGLIRRRGYQTRSEAIRDLVRRELVKEEWSEPGKEVVGTVTLVYEHHAHDLADRLADLQHAHHKSIVCSTHVHMDAHNCLEVVVVRGKSALVRKISDSLISTRGVKHGDLVASTTGKGVR
jgi:CopG family transcriptional regulator, nickel-responsive regulator